MTMHIESNSTLLMVAKPSASDDHPIAADEDGNPTNSITYMDAQLYKAAAKGHTDILGRLSADDLRLQLTPQRNTLLHIASRFGKLDSVQLILQFPSSSFLLQQPNREGDTALHLAAREGHHEVVKALIHAAKALHTEIESDVGADKAMMRMTNETGGTALHEAIRYNHLKVVKLLVEKDPDFTYGADSVGYTPLYMAAERGYGGLVKILIENTGISPAHGGIKGRTALHAAVIRRSLAMTRSILQWKPNLAREVDEEGWSPLHWAAHVKHAAIAKELLNKWPDKSVIYLGINHSKRTALHIATLVGSMDIVQLLLSYAPDCSEQVDANGNNVFHLAATSSVHIHPMGGKLLKMDGLRVRGLANAKDAEGDTPLHLLASSGVDDKPFIRDEIVDKKARNKKHLYANEKMASDDYFSLKTLYVFAKEVGGYSGLPKSLQPPVLDKNKDEAEEEEKEKAREKEHESSTDREWHCNFREAGNSHLVVATLIATVAFAAGFTLPGGFGGEDGMAMLSKKASFKAFVVSDAIALTLSLAAVFLHFVRSTTIPFGPRVYSRLFSCAYCYTFLGIGALLVAFMTGLYAVLPFSFGLPVLASCAVIWVFNYELGNLLLSRDSAKLLHFLVQALVISIVRFILSL